MKYSSCSAMRSSSMRDVEQRIVLDAELGQDLVAGPCMILARGS